MGTYLPRVSKLRRPEYESSSVQKGVSSPEDAKRASTKMCLFFRKKWRGADVWPRLGAGTGIEIQV